MTSRPVTSPHQQPGAATDPLSFRFDIDDAQRDDGVQGLRLPARVRVALLRRGLERLGDLDGLSARDVARRAGLQAPATRALVRELRWRCVASLPGWTLVRGAAIERLWLPRPVRFRLVRAGLATVEGLFALGDTALARLAGEEPDWACATLDDLARLAELPPERILDASASADPWELPTIEPVTIIGLAAAGSVVEQAAALALGPPARDSILLARRWLHSTPAPPGFEHLGREFGLTGERVRQIVSAREELVKRAGLRAATLDPAGRGTAAAQPARERIAAYVPAAGALLLRLGL